MRVVVDTNVFVASFLNPRGTPRQIIDLWKSGSITLCLCTEILEEYMQVLLRFGMEGEPELEDLLNLFKSGGNIMFTAISSTLHVVADDPSDDKFIECAAEAHAEAIITGDEHLKALKHYEGIQIIPPSEFLKLVKRMKSE